MKDDISEELQSHLDLHTADNIRAGMSPDEAQRQARIALGGVESTKEHYRERRKTRLLDELAQDARFALRVILRDPGFALTVIAVLALGIGANAAIFSVVDALMLKPLPFHEPDRLAMIWEDASAVGFPRNTPAPGNYFSWKERNHTFADIAATRGASANLTVDGPPEFVLGRRVTANFFDVLGVQPLLGRTFTEEEDRRGERVALISYALWQARYNADRGIVGKAITINGERRTIIGVMPRTFVFRDRDREFWTPIELSPEQRTLRTSHFLNVVGRLKPGVTLDTARKDIGAVSASLQQEFPVSNEGVGAVVEPLRSDILGNKREQLFVLIAAAVCVLLIACANVAGLLLLRAYNRRGELAVRASLGATGGRIIRQLVAEGALLALIGAALGLLMAPAAIHALAGMVPAGMFPLDPSVMDARLVMVTMAIALLTAVGFSLGPALHAARAPLVEGLQQAGRSRMTNVRLSREVLVVCQIALAVVLLVGTGLLLRTFANLRESELGFRPDHLLTLRTSLPLAKYAEHSNRVSFYERVIAGVRGLPGVQGAAYVSTPPFASIGNTSGFLLEGGRSSEPQDALVRVGTVDYLKTIGVELIDGRLLDARDQENAPPAVVINETFARLHWPGQSPVGRRISINGPGEMLTIVGVVRDVRERGFEPDMKPGVYFPNTQVSGTTFVPEVMVVRAAGDPYSLVPSIRRVVAAIDPEQPVSAVRMMEEVLDLSVVDRRQQATLLGIFAGVALVLAALGLYAVLAYGVAQRRREIAVRMAVGAHANSIVRTVAWEGQKLALMGLAIGLAGAWAVSRAMGSLLRGVAPTDPVTYGTAGTILWVVAMLACAIPALRAARVSPSALLRGD